MRSGRPWRDCASRLQPGRRWSRPSFALMQAAGRPQRRGRGWETPAAAAARGPARCRDRRPGVLRRAAPLGDREPRLGRHHANGARRAAAGPRAGLKDQCRRPSRGHPLARWRLRPRRRRATHADGTRCGRIPLSPHQVNRRVQVLATALGLEGVSSHLIDRRCTAGRAGVGGRGCSASWSARDEPPVATVLCKIPTPSLGDDRGY